MGVKIQAFLEELDRSPNPVFATDENNRIVAWNRAMVGLSGHGRDTAVGSYCHELLAGRDACGNRFCDRECAVLRMVRREEPVKSFEIAVRSASGETVQARCTVAVVPGSPRSTLTLVHVVESVDPRRVIPGCPRDDAAAGLTPRERQVLRMLASGSGTDEIANALCISPTTVRTHIRNTLKKLNVHSRLEAVVVAGRAGIAGNPGKS